MADSYCQLPWFIIYLLHSHIWYEIHTIEIIHNCLHVIGSVSHSASITLAKNQSASESHRELLKQYGIRQNRSREGNRWDNAVPESFFNTLKTELNYHPRFRNRNETRLAVFEYIEIFYNRERLHLANAYLSSIDNELQQKSV